MESSGSAGSGRRLSFRAMSPSERLASALETARGEKLDAETCRELLQQRQPDPQLAASLIENSVGYFSMPLGVANHFLIDDTEFLIPMAIEETSIIAAASAAAKWLKERASVRTAMRGTRILGQVQFPDVSDPERLISTLTARRSELLATANSAIPGLIRRGGGVMDARFRALARPDRPAAEPSWMVVIDLECEPCDAMGANLINQACEALKPSLELWTGERVGLCILSNLTDTRLACAEVRVPLSKVDTDLARRIADASLFASLDPYRAATHNKGVMNGIDAVLLATGNDWRAVEAGVHAYAARSGTYQPVAVWKIEGSELVGTLEAPIAVGTVGGVTRLHPAARFALQLLGPKSSTELSRICAAVGLVQNLAALKALCTTGIVRGHMQLHASNLALMAGASSDELPQILHELNAKLASTGQLQLTDAHEAVLRLRRSRVESSSRSLFLN